MNAKSEIDNNNTQNTLAMFECEMSRIHLRVNFNPRKHSNDSIRSALKQSIEHDGVQTPITVRPHPTLDNDFEVCAGATRFTLSQELGRTTIPVIVKDLDDDEMEKIAITENLQRQGMNPIDEGKAAQSILAKNENDTEEVKRLFGWSDTKLKSRILLTHATDIVADALSKGLIKLGHAELLCGLKESSQEPGLKLIINQKLSVEQTRARIESKSLELSSAIFDTAGCNGCANNTTAQASLFESGYSAGKCLNSDCFKSKSTDALNAKKAELADSFHTVRLSGEIAKDASKIIVISGNEGIGESQFSACQGCSNFGASISEVLSEQGKVTKNICFDLTCHAKKVATHTKALKAIDATPSVVAQKDGKTTTPAEKKLKGSPVSAKKTNAEKASAIPIKIIGMNHVAHRKAAAQFVSENTVYTKALALIAVINDARLSIKDMEAVGLKIEGIVSMQRPRHEVFSELSTWNEAQLEEAIQKAVKLSIEKSVSSHGGNEKQPEDDTYGGIAVNVCKTYCLGLGESFLMSKDYLEAHTKPVIANILAESGFSAKYESQHGEKSFETLMKNKKDDIVKTIFADDFDWAGYVPSSMRLTTTETKSGEV